MEHDLISLEITLPSYAAWTTSLSVSFQHIWFEHKLPRGRLFQCFLSCFATSQSPWWWKQCRFMWERSYELFLDGQYFFWWVVDFFFRFVTWLSFQSGTNWGCSLLCQLNTMIKLCLSLIRCLNSVFVSIWKGKTRNRSTQVFWYEEDKTIFTGFPEYNFIKADTSEWRFFKMYILITWKKCNKTCAWRFMGTPNFTKMNINIYIWTIQS